MSNREQELKTGSELLEDFLVQTLLELNRELTKLRKEKAALQEQLLLVRKFRRKKYRWRWWMKKRRRG